MRAGAAGEDGVDQLLGGGLTIGSSDADDGDGELATVVGCQLLESGKHIVDYHTAVVDLILRVADDTERSALLQSLWCKGVAIKGSPPEGKEEASRSNLPRVGGDTARLEIGLVELFYIHRVLMLHY